MSALKSKKDKQINLLPKDKFSETNLGKIVNWVLTTFRIIVIFVELLVVSAFLSRFWLDTRNADLNDEIKQKQAQIKAYETTEKNFRNLQKRILAFSILSSQTSYSSIIDSIPPLMPPTITLNSISLSDQGISMTGNAPDEKILAQFIANLKSEKKFEKVALSQLGPNQENKTSLKFIINIGINKE